MDVQRFDAGNRCRFIGHADHSPPLMFEEIDDANPRGEVVEVLADGLCRVALDKRRADPVQLHVDQLERLY